MTYVVWLTNFEPILIHDQLLVNQISELVNQLCR